MVSSVRIARALPVRRAVAFGAALLCAACGRSQGAAPAGPTPAETVGVGYGTQDARNVPQTIVSVTPSDLDKVKVGRIEEMLQGRFAGVQVVRTSDGGFSVRIRGTGSPSRNIEPLYVIDGMPVRISPGQGLTWINPADIARIDVLKGAAAGVYGSTGGNGVVLITTRR